MAQVLSHPPRVLQGHEIEQLLLENEELLLRVAAEMNEKKNKNFVPAGVLGQIHRLERNLMRLCKGVGVKQLNDEKVLQSEKATFQRYYTKRGDRK